MIPIEVKSGIIEFIFDTKSMSYILCEAKLIIYSLAVLVFAICCITELKSVNINWELIFHVHQ